MKIFFPVEVLYPSQAGGTANTVYWLTKNLARHGFESTIIATDKGITGQVPLGRWIENESGRSKFIRTFIVNFPFHQTLASLLEFRRADVVHLSSVFYPSAFITAFAARLLRKKIAWSVHGELADFALNYSAGRKRPILWAIKRFFGTYPLFHSTSSEETAEIRGVFGSDARISQILNYVELDDQVEREAGDYVLYIGRIHPKKAIDNLIRGLKMSAAFMRSEMVLKIAGIGREEYVRELRLLVSELGLENKVEFVGQVEGETKSRLLANAYFTLMPSHTENFGIVVLESLAQGTPVVASRGTPWESLETEKIGFWTDNSPEELASILDRVLDMEGEEYQGYRSRGRGYVEREFDIRNHISEWIEFYGSLR